MLATLLNQLIKPYFVWTLSLARQTTTVAKRALFLPLPHPLKSPATETLWNFFRSVRLERL
ncbi:hypothetical protein H6H03_38450 [Nostoc paludosum FACHB-159]|uniref:Uncharacterized protein n=1 Tax=Nostoc paludosum FACHB-159 TaxID=2692908 RepID=A0ABR8KNV3_9NOSO|nr:hypothetical protein [Nostoc paludosum]MBD2739665.1 hypothetical protein [Nostoc paludosum FACHB-159]